MMASSVRSCMTKEVMVTSSAMNLSGCDVRLTTASDLTLALPLVSYAEQHEAGT